MRLGYVCTNYNSSHFTRAAVASLHAGHRSADVRVVVVDNQSRDEHVMSLATIADEFPGVEVVWNAKNAGYFPGLNVGIRHLRSTFPEIEFLAVGNNDLVFPPDFVNTIEHYRDVFDEWAVVAPDLVTPDGVHQNPHVLHPIGRIRKLLWAAYFQWYPAALVMEQMARAGRGFAARAEKLPNSQFYKVPGPVEQGYGACYLLGPLFFQHFRELCAPTFMMQEEFFLSEQLKLIGQQAYYDPRFVIQHRGRASTNQLTGVRQWQIAQEAYRVYERYLAMSSADQARLLGVTRLEPS